MRVETLTHLNTHRTSRRLAQPQLPVPGDRAAQFCPPASDRKCKLQPINMPPSTTRQAPSPTCPVKRRQRGDLICHVCGLLEAPQQLLSHCRVAQGRQVSLQAGEGAGEGAAGGGGGTL